MIAPIQAWKRWINSVNIANNRLVRLKIYCEQTLRRIRLAHLDGAHILINFGVDEASETISGSIEWFKNIE